MLVGKLCVFVIKGFCEWGNTMVSAAASQQEGAFCMELASFPVYTFSG